MKSEFDMVNNKQIHINILLHNYKEDIDSHIKFTIKSNRKLKFSFSN